MNIKKEKISLLEDIKRLKQDKQALEVDLEKMKKERDQAKDQIAYTTGKTLGWSSLPSYSWLFFILEFK